jgi:hypothetical protein
VPGVAELNDAVIALIPLLMYTLGAWVLGIRS